MANQNLRELGDAELVHFLLSTEHGMVESRFKHSLNQLENTASLRDVRRDIARARTELRAREIASGVGPNTLSREHRGSFSIGAGEVSSVEKGGFLSGVVDKLSPAE